MVGSVVTDIVQDMIKEILKATKSLPEIFVLIILTAASTLLLIRLTESWLPDRFFNIIISSAYMPRIADFSSFYLVITGAVLLYLLSIIVCSLTTAFILRPGFRFLLKLVTSRFEI